MEFVTFVGGLCVGVVLGLMLASFMLPVCKDAAEKESQ